MSDDRTARLALPLLSAGQAQKEMTHNEALTLLDLFAQPVVIAVGGDTPPESPGAGQCWIVGMVPTGAWAGYPHHLVGWTGGGWRFCAPAPGMRAWSLADAAEAWFGDGGWSIGTLRGARVEIAGIQVVAAQQAAISAPSGGTVIDAEARGTLTAVLAALHAHGLIAP